MSVEMPRAYSNWGLGMEHETLPVWIGADGRFRTVDSHAISTICGVTPSERTVVVLAPRDATQLTDDPVWASAKRANDPLLDVRVIVAKSADAEPSEFVVQLMGQGKRGSPTRASNARRVAREIASIANDVGVSYAAIAVLACETSSCVLELVEDPRVPGRSTSPTRRPSPGRSRT